MRLDIFLKLSRMVPRRSLAQAFCDAARVKLNGVLAKPSKEVKEGDEIEITRGAKVSTYRVRQIPQQKQVSKAGSAELIELIDESESDGII